MEDADSSKMLPSLRSNTSLDFVMLASSRGFGTCNWLSVLLNHLFAY